MSTWIDDFEGNKLSSKWIASRFSAGGQNDGVWLRQVVDSKIYWIGTSDGTENNWFGEKLSLPVNAVGDIIVNAVVRHKANGGTNGILAVGVNQASMTDHVDYGVELLLTGGAIYIRGYNGITITTWPALPSKLQNNTGSIDYLAELKIVRKNNVMFLYINGTFVGSYSFNPTITTVDILSIWHTNFTAQHWVDWIKVSPKSVII